MGMYRQQRTRAAVAVLAAVVTGTVVTNAPAQPNPQYAAAPTVSGTSISLITNPQFMVRVWSDGYTEWRRMGIEGNNPGTLCYGVGTEWAEMVEGCK